jgi:hypothetical protein
MLLWSGYSRPKSHIRVHATTNRNVLNRKNSLFVGNPRGGRTAAILASPTSTCRRHDIDPQLYLTQLLINLPTTCRAKSPRGCRINGSNFRPKEWPVSKTPLRPLHRHTYGRHDGLTNALLAPHRAVSLPHQIGSSVGVNVTEPCAHSGPQMIV